MSLVAALPRCVLLFNILSFAPMADVPSRVRYTSFRKRGDLSAGRRKKSALWYNLLGYYEFPQFDGISPDGDTLYVANVDSDSLTAP